jgi:hypothetical protein
VYLLESLKQADSKDALRDLSMITRQIKSQDDSLVDKIEESIDFAKRAIQLDLRDHKSWYVLGNAYCMKFFAYTRDVRDLAKALSAYQRSESLGGDCNPDLYYNKGNVHRYLQDFSGAVECYRQACAIDSSLSAANESLEDIKSFLIRISDMIEHKGWIKKKRLQAAIQDLSHFASLPLPPSVRVSANCHECTVASLNRGENSESYIHMKVIMSATKNSVPPECFLCVDKDNSCIVLSIYNLGSDASTMLMASGNQHTVTIVMPTLRPSYVIDFNALDSKNDSSTNITSPTNIPVIGMPKGIQVPAIIQAHNIENVYINGLRLPNNSIAPPQLKVDVYE